MHSYKRPIELPTPETLAAIFNNAKRQKLSIPRGLNDTRIDNRSTDASHSNTFPPHHHHNLSPPALSIPFGQQQLSNVPLLNSAPPNIIPIIHPPAIISDYFTDVKTDLSNKKLANQISGIIQKFPPPMPPFAANLHRQFEHDITSPTAAENKDDTSSSSPNEAGGIMVPFIYPPPPIIQPDKLPYSISSLYHPPQKEPSVPIAHGPKIRGRKPKRRPEFDAPEDIDSQYALPDGIFVQAPPLPFPPPNYMPYPLLADQATLVPEELFGAFLEASEELPRIDMVVASAAGSLFEMRDQAKSEGFTIDGYEQSEGLEEYRAYLMKKHRYGGRKGNNNDEDKVDHEEREDDEEGREDLEYLSGIDTSEFVDRYQEDRRDDLQVEINITDPRFTRMKQKMSSGGSDIEEKEDKNVRPLEDLQVYMPLEADDTLKKLQVEDIISKPGMEIIFPTGTNRERRRKQLVKKVNDLEEFEEKHREEIYWKRKNELLNRLSALRNSKIKFNHMDIKDKELAEYREKLELERDQELIRLKLQENYELLKSSMIFYEDSNKVYKNLNSVLINKLEKLKNFFEYQRDIFQDCLDHKQDIFDINSKDSQKLFTGISERNYSQLIKDVIKDSILHDIAPDQPQPGIQPLELPNVDLTKLPAQSSTPTADVYGDVLVHDFMPMITPEEFSIITGNIVTKSKSSKNSNDTKPSANMKHQIFKNSLYDRMTSGSDSNASDSGVLSSGFGSGSGTTTPKRRGRRSGTQQPAANGTGNGAGGGGSSDKTKESGIVGGNVGLDVKYSEATLLAKIMKQFSGPQMAKSDELNYDLEKMGIETRWPVSK
ncbi:uncharacterized protein J8A68_000793 [[Candida] subhashii]|uniref:Uncharacterized protein n=1 Tax=[Candida] subhashii TaxID=561895 RepID=A0A8J5QVN3_9ASCO|nr:uncharacterized protein J8A68_000793 [[Candida] subhashii]KAG7665587.1 hypothetical protein J8A68_000793 [[Candida] subhashii]